MPCDGQTQYSTITANPHRKSVQEIVAEAHAISARSAAERAAHPLHSRKVGEKRVATAARPARRFPSWIDTPSRAAPAHSCSNIGTSTSPHPQLPTPNRTRTPTPNEQIDLEALTLKRGRKPKPGARPWRDLDARAQSYLYAQVFTSRHPTPLAFTLQTNLTTITCPDNPADHLHRRIRYHLHCALGRHVDLWAAIEITPGAGNLHLHGFLDITPDEEPVVKKALRAAGGAWAKSSAAIARQVDFRRATSADAWAHYATKAITRTQDALRLLKPGTRVVAVTLVSASLKRAAQAFHEDKSTLTYHIEKYATSSLFKSPEPIHISHRQATPRRGIDVSTRNFARSIRTPVGRVERSRSDRYGLRPGHRWRSQCARLLRRDSGRVSGGHDPPVRSRTIRNAGRIPPDGVTLRCPRRFSGRPSP